MRAESITLLGRTVRFWRGGDGPALILLQGGMADARLHWAPVWDLLKPRFTVIAPDWPGFGGSEAMPGASYEDMTDWLAAFQEAVIGDAADVAGNSFGGTIALLYAGAYPLAVRRLVLINGGGLPSEAVSRALASSDLDEPMLRDLGRAAFSRDVLARMVADEATLTDEFVAACQFNPAILRILRDALASSLPTLPWPTMPMLVLWGEGDRHTPPDIGRTLAAGIPGAAFALVPGAGHLPQVERPGAVAAALEDFLLEQAAEPR
jgi:pimeloyl-ACP methyl ester carboxylesterase